MLNSKQRAQLKGIAMNIDTIFQIGKGGIPDTLVKQVTDALKAREIIKVKVLDNSLYNAREAADELSSKTDSKVVQVIGSKFVLYKRNDEKPIISLK